MPTSCFPVDAPAPAQPARASFPVRRAAAIACALVAASTAAVAQTAPALGQWTPTRHHSGLHDNPSPVEGVVWRDFVTAGQAAPWVRLEFDRWRLGRGSYLRVVSLADGDHQTLHAEHVEQWQSTSAYFNGGAVMVELVAGPHSKGNFVSIERVLAGDPPGDAGEDSICGTQDDRTPSANAAVGRIMSLGCSGWIISNSAGGSATNKLHLSAGHCYGASQVLQFAVPASGANCSLVMPPASKQFAIDTASSQYVNNGIGNDWWVFKCFPNPNTGRTSWQEQAAAFTLAAGLPATGTTLRNFGFGLDGTNTDNGAGSSCTCSSTAGTGTRNQTQQTHTGALASVSGSALYHTIDTCGGNSGSVLLDDASGQAVAIHTNAGCTATGGANSGTAVTNAGLRSALQQMATTTHTLWAITVPETSSPASTTPWTDESYAAGAETCNDCNTTACQYSTNSTNGNTTPLRATDFQAFSLPAGQRIVNVRVEVSGRYDSNTTANVGFRAFAPAFGLNTNWRNSASFASGTLCAPRLGTTGDITSLSSSWTAAMINDLQFEVRRQASLSNNTLRVVSMRLIVTTSL